MHISRHRSDVKDRSAAQGILLRSPRRYDLQVWLATRGREKALRETILCLARIAPGETILDVGCGTGTLALGAKRLAGPEGRLFAVDASGEMVAAARAKAKKTGIDIHVSQGAAEALPFADSQFDLVTSTLMLHHMPRPTRKDSVLEAKRVLKPGGRLLVVDFASSSREQGGLLHRLHRHGRVTAEEILGIVAGEGFEVMEKGSLDFRDLHYVLARSPGALA